MRDARSGGAQGGGAFSRAGAARDAGAFARARLGTRVGGAASQGVGGIFCSRAAFKLQNPCEISGWAAVSGLRRGSIRKKIIGHGMCAVAARFAFRKHVGCARGPVALLHQQPREHGYGVFFHPLIKQRHDLLAEIGGMRQARQFKTLQGVPGSREQELPRWLSRACSHRPPNWNVGIFTAE
jgi:hypothetical protein